MEDMMKMFESPIMTDSGIAYYKFGNAEKSVLLVHGSFGSARMWMGYIKPLMEAGNAVYAVDLAGHGMSKGRLATATMDTYLQNVKDVIEHAKIQPVVIGHSMSGLTALMAAADGTAKKVVSIDPSPSKEVQGEKSTEGIPEVYNAGDAGMPMEDEAKMKALHDIPKEMMMKMQEMLGDESGAARKQRKLGVSVPKEALDGKEVLFISAEDGASLPFGISNESTQKMAKYYSKAIITVPDATHPGILMGEHAPEAIKAILDFIR